MIINKYGDETVEYESCTIESYRSTDRPQYVVFAIATTFSGQRVSVWFSEDEMFRLFGQIGMMMGREYPSDETEKG